MNILADITYRSRYHSSLIVLFPIKKCPILKASNIEKQLKIVSSPYSPVIIVTHSYRTRASTSHNLRQLISETRRYWFLEYFPLLKKVIIFPVWTTLPVNCEKMTSEFLRRKLQKYILSCIYCTRIDPPCKQRNTKPRRPPWTIPLRKYLLYFRNIKVN